MAVAAAGIGTLAAAVQILSAVDDGSKSSGSAADALADAMRTANATAGAKHDQKTARSLTDILAGADSQLRSVSLARMPRSILAPMPAIGADEDALGSLVDNDGFVMGKPEDRRAAYGEYLALIDKMAGGGLEPEPADANRLLAPLGLSLRSRGGEERGRLTHDIRESTALREDLERDVGHWNAKEKTAFGREVGAPDGDVRAGVNNGMFLPGGPPVWAPFGGPTDTSKQPPADPLLGVQAPTRRPVIVVITDRSADWRKMFASPFYSQFTLEPIDGDDEGDIRRLKDRVSQTMLQTPPSGFVGVDAIVNLNRHDEAIACMDRFDNSIRDIRPVIALLSLPGGAASILEYLTSLNTPGFVFAPVQVPWLKVGDATMSGAKNVILSDPITRDTDPEVAGATAAIRQAEASLLELARFDREYQDMMNRADQKGADASRIRDMPAYKLFVRAASFKRGLETRQAQLDKIRREKHEVEVQEQSRRNALVSERQSLLHVRGNDSDRIRATVRLEDLIAISAEMKTAADELSRVVPYAITDAGSQPRVSFDAELTAYAVLRVLRYKVEDLLFLLGILSTQIDVAVAATPAATPAVTPPATTAATPAATPAVTPAATPAAVAANTVATCERLLTLLDVPLGEGIRRQYDFMAAIDTLETDAARAVDEQKIIMLGFSDDDIDVATGRALSEGLEQAEADAAVLKQHMLGLDDQMKQIRDLQPDAALQAARGDLRSAEGKYYPGVTAPIAAGTVAPQAANELHRGGTMFAVARWKLVDKRDFVHAFESLRLAYNGTGSSVDWSGLGSVAVQVTAVNIHWAISGFIRFHINLASDRYARKDYSPSAPDVTFYVTSAEARDAAIQRTENMKQRRLMVDRQFLDARDSADFEAVAAAEETAARQRQALARQVTGQREALQWAAEQEAEAHRADPRQAAGRRIVWEPDIGVKPEETPEGREPLKKIQIISGGGQGGGLSTTLCFRACRPRPPPRRGAPRTSSPRSSAPWSAPTPRSGEPMPLLRWSSCGAGTDRLPRTGGPRRCRCSCATATPRTARSARRRGGGPRWSATSSRI